MNNAMGWIFFALLLGVIVAICLVLFFGWLTVMTVAFLIDFIKEKWNGSDKRRS